MVAYKYIGKVLLISEVAVIRTESRQLIQAPDLL